MKLGELVQEYDSNPSPDVLKDIEQEKNRLVEIIKKDTVTFEDVTYEKEVGHKTLSLHWEIRMSMTDEEIESERGYVTKETVTERVPIFPPKEIVEAAKEAREQLETSYNSSKSFEIRKIIAHNKKESQIVDESLLAGLNTPEEIFRTFYENNQLSSPAMEIAGTRLGIDIFDIYKKICQHAPFSYFSENLIKRLKLPKDHYEDVPETKDKPLEYKIKLFEALYSTTEDSKREFALYLLKNSILTEKDLKLIHKYIPPRIISDPHNCEADGRIKFYFIGKSLQLLQELYSRTTDEKFEEELMKDLCKDPNYRQ